MCPFTARRRELVCPLPLSTGYLLLVSEPNSHGQRNLHVCRTPRALDDTLAAAGAIIRNVDGLEQLPVDTPVAKRLGPIRSDQSISMPVAHP